MKIEPKRLLWPTDFSDLSMKAEPYVRGYRDTFGAELHLVHVCLPLVSCGYEVAEAQEQLMQGAHAQLAQFVAEQFGADSRVKSATLLGSPWSQICAYAGDNEVDLIVMATHGRTGLPHLFIGSTAERVVRHAPCPVLTVRSIQQDSTFREDS